ncbi:MAG: ECF transporter S component [Anaerolineae bacterium]
MQAENVSRSSSTPAVYRVVLAGVLTSLTVLMSLVPSVGLIPVPSPAAHATLLHIPAIIGAILGGPIVGVLVSTTFGVMSFLMATVPMFKDPSVAILPRVFIGLAAWLAYAGALRADRRTLQVLAVLVSLIAAWFSWQVHAVNPVVGWTVLIAAVASGIALVYLVRGGRPGSVAVLVAALVGTFTNTALVLGMASLLGYLPAEGVFLIATTHGIPEAIVAAVVVTAVVGAVRGTGRRQKSSL